MRMKLIVLSTIIAVGLFACLMKGRSPKTNGSPSGKGDSSVLVESEDAEMNAAIAEARATIGEFREHLQRPAAGETGFSVKVAIVDGQHTEHFWTTNVRIKGAGFLADINNDPEHVHNVKLGQTVEVTPENLSDWMYVRGNKMIGNRTARVLIKRMPKDQADAIFKKMGMDP